jgi:hypothetical protein
MRAVAAETESEVLVESVSGRGARPPTVGRYVDERRAPGWLTSGWTHPRNQGSLVACGRGGKPAGSGGPPSRRALLVGGGLVAVAGGDAVARTINPRIPSTTAQRSPAPTVAITDLGHPLLGMTVGWELFALGDDAGHTGSTVVAAGVQRATVLRCVTSIDVRLAPVRAGLFMVHRGARH